MPIDVAEAAGIGDGDLIEISTGRGAPLRAWADVQGTGEALLAGPSSLRIVRAAPGDVVTIAPARPIPKL